MQKTVAAALALLAVLCQFGQASADEEAPPREESLLWTAERRRIAVAITGGIANRTARLTELDAYLARDGFAALPFARLGFGFGTEVQLWRLRLGIDLFGFPGSSHNAIGIEASAHVSDAEFRLGYDFWRFGPFSATAAAAFTASSVTLRFDDGTGTGFDEGVAGVKRVGVKREVYGATLELGGDTLLPFAQLGDGTRFAFLFGFRVAGILQFASGGWRTTDGEEQDLRGGPAIDLSGWRGRLMGGIAVY